MATIANTESEILTRIILPNQPGMEPSVAQAILALDFRDEDHARMSELSEKAQCGALTAEEQIELDSYERVGHFLSLLQSKARLSLAKSA